MKPEMPGDKWQCFVLLNAVGIVLDYNTLTMRNIELSSHNNMECDVKSQGKCFVEQPILRQELPLAMSLDVACGVGVELRMKFIVIGNVLLMRISGRDACHRFQLFAISHTSPDAWEYGYLGLVPTTSRMSRA